MAAAYETGSALGSVDLLQKFVAFLAAQGWTTNLSAADGAGWRAHMSKGSLYANLRAYTGADVNTDISVSASGDATKAGIALYLGTGFNGAVSWRSQAGGARSDSGVNTLIPTMWLRSDAVLSYHFLDDGSDHLVVEAESVAGVHNFFGFGSSVDKAGAWTWGEYYFASAPVYILQGDTTDPGFGVSASPPFAMGGVANAGAGASTSRAFVRADVDSFTPEWAAFGASVVGSGSGYIYGYTGLRGSSDVSGASAPVAEIPGYSGLLPQTSNSFNGRTVLLPIHVFTERGAGGYSLLGTVPDLFVGYGDFTPGEIYSIGADDYLAFPTNVARQNWFVRKRA